MKLFSSVRIFLAVMLGLAWLTSQPCFSFPIEPVSLRNLIISSKVIVWARVEALENPVKTFARRQWVCHGGFVIRGKESLL